MAGFHDITAAIIGAGFIGPVHVEGLRRLGVRVKGIAGISKDEAERAAGTLGLERAYASVDELLGDPRRPRACTSRRPTACTTITRWPRSPRASTSSARSRWR